MFKTLRTLLEIFWIADVVNLPFIEMFDTTYPLNGAFWFITIAVLIVESGQIKIFSDEDKDE